MKGVVFTELLEMVEARFSLGVVDTIITRSAPASGAHYTSVGTYPSEELVALVRELSAVTAGVSAAASSPRTLPAIEALVILSSMPSATSR